MGKKYMETKKGSLEQSVLNVWKDAADMHEEGFDGRTKDYREHRAKLENKRVKRESKKNTPKMEQPETEHGSGEHAFEVGTKRFNDYTKEITPGQVEEEIAELNALIEELEEGILGNIAKAAGKTVAKGVKAGAKKAGGKIKKKVGGSMIGKAFGKVKAGAKKAKDIGGKIKKAAKTGTAYGDQYDPMIEQLEIIESKLDEYYTILETEDLNEKMSRQLKDPDKEMMVVKNGKVEVIDKKDKEKFMKKGYDVAEAVEEEVELDEAKYLEIDFKDKSTAAKAYDYINNEIWAGGNPPYDDFNQEGNSLQIDHSKNAKDLLDDLKDLPRNMKFKVAVNEAASPDWAEPKNLRDTIIAMWTEASSQVNPKDREELDVDVKDSAKKMKRADEPAPMVATEEVIDEKLSAKQKKLDVDGDGEIEGSDLAKLRKKAKKEGKDVLDVAKEMKVASMKEAIAKVWGYEEGYGKKKMKEGGMKRLATGGKDALKGFKPKPKKEGNKADTGEDVAAVELDPKIKEKK